MSQTSSVLLHILVFWQSCNLVMLRNSFLIVYGFEKISISIESRIGIFDSLKGTPLETILGFFTALVFILYFKILA